MSLQRHVYWIDRGLVEKPRKPAAVPQEEALLALLGRLEFRSVLDLGAGAGRISALVAEHWPDVAITSLDISPTRLARLSVLLPSAETILAPIEHWSPGKRHWDLVIAVEFLMHLPPGTVRSTVRKMLHAASRYIVSIDWGVPAERQIGPPDYLHDYRSLYAALHPRVIEIETIDRQVMCLVRR